MNHQLLIREQHEITPDLALLDADELARYQRLINPQKKLELVTGRTFLKQVLAERLGVSPNTISLSLTASGKPHLPALAETTTPYFNLSHANGYYLVGLSSFPIGVDIEQPKAIELTHVRHFLAPDEYQQLKSLPKALHPSLFFRLFTAKEAFLKATDKAWALDDIRFQLENQYWKLTNPGDSFQFYQTDYKDSYVSVCLDMNPIHTNILTPPAAP